MSMSIDLHFAAPICRHHTNESWTSGKFKVVWLHHGVLQATCVECGAWEISAWEISANAMTGVLPKPPAPPPATQSVEVWDEIKDLKANLKAGLEAVECRAAAAVAKVLAQQQYRQKEALKDLLTLAASKADGLNLERLNHHLKQLDAPEQKP